MPVPPEAIQDFLSNNQLSLAEKSLREAYRETDNPAEYHDPQMRLLLKQGKAKEAFQFAQELLRSNPNDKVAHWYLPQILTLQGRYEEAVEGLNSLIAKGNSHEAFLWAYKANLYWNHLEVPVEKIQESLKKALEIDPSNDLAQNIEYEIAHDLNDTNKMAEIIRSITQGGQKILKARVLARHIAETCPEDLAGVQSLLRQFPQDSEIRNWVIECQVNRFFLIRFIRRWKWSAKLIDEKIRETGKERSLKIIFKTSIFFGIPLLAKWIAHHSSIVAGLLPIFLFLWVLVFVLFYLFKILVQNLRTLVLIYYKRRGHRNH